MMNWKAFERKRYYPVICLKELRKMTKNSVSRASILAEIQTACNLNTSVEYYLQANLFNRKLWFSNTHNLQV
jgi:hypothetical protein